MSSTRPDDLDRAAVYERCATLADFRQQRPSIDSATAAAISKAYTNHKFGKRKALTLEEAYLHTRHSVLERVRAAAQQRPPPNNDALNFTRLASPSPSSPPLLCTGYQADQPLSLGISAALTTSLRKHTLSSPSSPPRPPPHCAGCDAWRAMYEQVRKPSNGDDVAVIARALREADEQCVALSYSVQSLQQHVAWMEQVGGELEQQVERLRETSIGLAHLLCVQEESEEQQHV